VKSLAALIAPSTSSLPAVSSTRSGTPVALLPSLKPPSQVIVSSPLS